MFVLSICIIKIFFIKKLHFLNLKKKRINTVLYKNNEKNIESEHLIKVKFSIRIYEIE